MYTMYIKRITMVLPTKQCDDSSLLGMRSRVAGILHMECCGRVVVFKNRRFYQRGDERSPFEVPHL